MPLAYKLAIIIYREIGTAYANAILCYIMKN